MKIKIIDIGNSKGVRLPQSVIKQYKFDGEACLELHEDGILLTPATKPREGWAEKFMKADIKISSTEKEFMDTKNKFDEEEWKW